jgi:C4-dicarboxylate transporter, DctQ subunit
MNPRQEKNSAFDSLMGYLAAFAGVLIVLTVFLVCGDVLIKWITGRSVVWVQETVEFSLLWLTFLGASWVLREGAHIKMDLIANRLRPGARRVLDLTMSFVGAAICLIITYYSARVTWHHAKTGYKLLTFMSPPSAAIDFIIPVGFLLIAIQFIRRGSRISRRRGDQFQGNAPTV